MQPSYFSGLAVSFSSRKLVLNVLILSTLVALWSQPLLADRCPLFLLLSSRLNGVINEVERPHIWVTASVQMGVL